MIHKIQVTQQDIDEGVPATAWGCPVAKAISRVLGRKVSVAPKYQYIKDLPQQEVYYGASTWEDTPKGGLPTTYRLPDEARQLED